MRSQRRLSSDDIFNSSARAEAADFGRREESEGVDASMCRVFFWREGWRMEKL